MPTRYLIVDVDVQHYVRESESYSKAASFQILAAPTPNALAVAITQAVELYRAELAARRNGAEVQSDLGSVRAVSAVITGTAYTANLTG